MLRLYALYIERIYKAPQKSILLNVGKDKAHRKTNLVKHSTNIIFKILGLRSKLGHPIP